MIQQVAYEALERLAGVALPLDGLLTLVFFTLAFFVGIKYLFRLFRRTVWRLRNRLILAYVFIGVVPITLILVMLGLGMYILMGQVATYLMTAELNRRNEVVRDCAYALAWNVADHLGSDQGESAANQFIQPLRRRLAGLQAVMRVDGKTLQIPRNAGVSEFPRWSQHGFLGLVAAGREYALAADVRVEQPSHRVEVFAYESADTSLLGNLLPGMASISLLAIDDDSTNDLGKTEEQPLEQSGREFTSGRFLRIVKKRQSRYWLPGRGGTSLFAGVLSSRCEHGRAAPSQLKCWFGWLPGPRSLSRNCSARSGH